MPEVATPLTKKDFQTDQDVRWCPGCGDYAILNSVQQVFPKLGVPREKVVFVSGIGCSSRFPYYMNTYGFHSIHGRALAIATGLKIANPALTVWVVTGDGDCMSIGGNHMIHMLRRNLDIKVLMFNNRIYGLTKGQYSPTSEFGKINKTAPLGTIDRPVNPISLALASGATFVARTVDIYAKHLQETLHRAAAHKGSAFVEIYQNCNIFNDKAWEHLTEKDVRDDRNVLLEHGKPLVFGPNKEFGLRLKSGVTVEKVRLGENGVTEKDLLVHDEKAPNATLAYLLSRLGPPDFPEEFGVYRAIDLPSYEEGIYKQVKTAKDKAGPGDLKKLLNAGDTWTVS